MFFGIWGSFHRGRQGAEAVKADKQFSDVMDFIESNQLNLHVQERISEGFVAFYEKFRELAIQQLPQHLHDNYINFVPSRNLRIEAKNFKRQAADNARSDDPKRVILGFTHELFGFYLLCMSWDFGPLPKSGRSALNSPGVVRARIHNRLFKFLLRFDMKIDK